MNEEGLIRCIVKPRAFPPIAIRRTRSTSVHSCGPGKGKRAMTERRGRERQKRQTAHAGSYTHKSGPTSLWTWQNWCSVVCMHVLDLSARGHSSPTGESFSRSSKPFRTRPRSILWETARAVSASIVVHASFSNCWPCSAFKCDVCGGVQMRVWTSHNSHGHVCTRSPGELRMSPGPARICFRVPFTFTPTIIEYHATLPPSASPFMAPASMSGSRMPRTSSRCMRPSPLFAHFSLCDTLISPPPLSLDRVASSLHSRPPNAAQNARWEALAGTGIR